MSSPFRKQFRFDKKRAYHIGVEREFFITDASGTIVPEAHRVLKHIQNPIDKVGSFSYELSACQIESQTVPVFELDHLRKVLELSEAALDTALLQLGLGKTSIPVGPPDMCLDVYPDPSGRYAEMVRKMSLEMRGAASRTIATHIHIGAPDQETALKMYNKIAQHGSEIEKNDYKCDPERMRLYKIVAPNYIPRPYSSWDEFETYAREHGFYKNPRNCWHLVRISKHGTIEFRYFRSTNSIDDIVNWAEECRDILCHLD